MIYFIAPEKFRNLVLFAGSIVFYTYGEAAYVLLLLASVVVNYLIGVEMNSQWARGSDISRRVLLFTAL